MPGRYQATPLGSSPADSRFCSRGAGYSVLYASPDFATAFIETVVRDRFMRRRDRDVALKAGFRLAVVGRSATLWTVRAIVHAA